MKRFKKNNKGFSLVELIVVIAIMAILGVAVALAVTKFIPEANRATDISNAAMLGEAIEVVATEYQTKGTALPTDSDAWGTALTTSGEVKAIPDVKGDASAYGVTAADCKFDLSYSATAGATIKIVTKAGATQKVVLVGSGAVNGAKYKANEAP